MTGHNNLDERPAVEANSLSEFFGPVVRRARGLGSHGGFRKYFFNTGWMFLGKIGTTVFSLASTLIVVRYLDPAQYGLLSYCLSYTSLFGFLCSLGIESVLGRDLVKYRQEMNALLGTAFVLRILGSTVAFSSICAFLVVFPEAADTRLMIVTIALGSFFLPLNNISILFQSDVRLKSVSAVILFVNILLSVSKIALAVLSLPLHYFAVVLMLDPVLTGVLYVAIYQRQSSVTKWRYDRGIAVSLFRESWPLMFTSAFMVIYSRIDQVLIKQLIDLGSVGIYSVAAQLSEYWYFIPNGLVFSLMPGIVSGKMSGSREYRKRVIALTVLVLAISLLAAIAISSMASEIINLVYGEKYALAAEVLRIYIWAGIGMSLTFVVNQVLVVEKQTFLYLIGSLFGMISNVALNLIWIPQYGIHGAAFATVVSYSAVPIVCLLLLNLFRSRAMSR